MANIYAVNAGSSSLKFQLLEMPSEEVITEGVVERIGLEDGIFTLKFNGEKNKEVTDIPNHGVAVSMLLKKLVDMKIVASLDEIDGCGHRMVHGGEKFTDSAVITDEVIAGIEAVSDLAPLHNPANLTGYRAFKEALPNIPHVGVFDTAFHQTMPKTSYIYPIPYEYYEKYGVRRYGFHGTSHKYVSARAIEMLGNPETSKIITCHLGNGASLAAVKDGKSINTSMGLTPLAGIMMGTRSGDIDPAIITFLAEKEGKTADQITSELNKKSGMLGVSGISSDSRDVEDAAIAGDPQAIFTEALYAQRIADVIGSYFMQLGGCDAIVFTAGLGENNAMLRANVISLISEATGAKICEDKNNVRGKETLVSTEDSKIKVLLIPTNEELVIARDVVKLSK
jgi:acetate kinase